MKIEHSERRSGIVARMKRRLVFLLLVLVVPPTSSEAASIIYTYGRSETDSFSSYLFSVDPDTGATQRIGTPHTGVVNELSSRPGDSTYIYGTFGGGASTDRAVGKINRFTGSLSLTALKTPILLDEFGDPVGLPPWQPVGFSIAPTRPDVGIILGLTTQGNTFIYEVSLETGLPLGTAILTRNRRQAIRLQAITFSETGETLFAISGNPPFSGGGFGTVDLETGLFQSFGALFDYVAGMEFDPSRGDVVASVTLGNSPLDLVRLSVEGDITETVRDPLGNPLFLGAGIAIVETPEGDIWVSLAGAIACLLGHRRLIRMKCDAGWAQAGVAGSYSRLMAGRRTAGSL